MRRLLIAIVKGYRLLLSPWLGNACRFSPTCSVYAIEALELHGAARGSYLAVRRLVRCQPWCAGGHDPVPGASGASRSAGAGLFTSLGTTPGPSGASPSPESADRAHAGSGGTFQSRKKSSS